MITSPENRGWPGDVAIDALAGTGLPVSSVIRAAKIAMIDASDATRLGTVSDKLMRQVMERLGRTLATGD